MVEYRPASKTVRIATLVGGISIAFATPLVSTASASAASVSTWDAVAQCESSGDWHNADSGGTLHFGGLQFSRSSWAAAGGLKYAWRADYATKDQQIAVAEVLLKMQGPGAWQCAAAGGLTPGGPAPDIHPSSSTRSAKSTGAATSAPKGAHPSARPTGHSALVNHGHGDYTVRSGDTLSGIAWAHHVPGGWQQLYHLNKDIVSDPNLIYPGQLLHFG